MDLYPLPAGADAEALRKLLNQVVDALKEKPLTTPQKPGPWTDFNWPEPAGPQDVQAAPPLYAERRPGGTVVWMDPRIVDELRKLAAGGDDTELELHDLLGEKHEDADTHAAVAGDIIYADATPEWTALGIGTEDQVLTVSAGGLPEWASATHNVLNGGVHPDTAAHAATKGDLIYADGTPVWNALGIGAENQVLTVSASGVPEWATPGGTYAPSDHDLLSGTHGDTTTADPVAGDLVRAVTVTGTPKWQRYAVGAEGQVLTVNSSGLPEWQAAGYGSHNLLDGSIHSDTTAHTPVAKGDMIAGEGTGNKWTALTVGTNGQVLVADSAEALGVKWQDADAAFASDAVAVGVGVWVKITGNTADTSLDSNDWRGRGIHINVWGDDDAAADLKTLDWQSPLVNNYKMIGCNYASDFDLTGDIAAAAGMPPPGIKVQVDGTDGHLFISVTDYEGGPGEINLYIHAIGGERRTDPTITIT